MKRILVIATVAMMAVISTQAQIKRSDAFRAKYELKEVVVMSRHNIRSPLTSGGAASYWLSQARDSSVSSKWKRIWILR
ncbi:MAG: hypothetical protein IKN58_10970 [Prevotella sp.]|nr:hypothetical protein [Prevotella sp.]